VSRKRGKRPKPAVEAIPDDILAEGSGAVVSVTEHGEVLNPAFRTIQTFALGQASSIEGYLRDLARRLGEPATIRRGL